MNQRSGNSGERNKSRDVVVTGVGFCLPGAAEPVFTADDMWAVISNGRSCLKRDEVYYGSVELTQEMFDERLPDVPPFFSRHYTSAHRFGLVSMAEATTDAGLTTYGGALSEAAILVGRGGIDANIESYLSVLSADPGKTSAPDAMELFVAAEQAVTPSDVALVQAALTQSNGPCYTVSCGCASSAVQVGNARRMIAQGEVEVAVVTGVDVFNVHLIQNIQRLLSGAQQTYDALRTTDMPELLPSFTSLMRPYDRRADCINHGEGAATVILESREHAARRGAHMYGRAGHRHDPGRPGQPPRVRRDRRGAGHRRPPLPRRPVADRRRAVRPRRQRRQHRRHRLRGGRHPGAVRARERRAGHLPGGLLRPQRGAGRLPGRRHDADDDGAGQVCPTANCEQPADGLPFDPVPGVRPRPLDFDYALSFNYQVGGVKNAILLGSPEAV